MFQPCYTRSLNFIDKTTNSSLSVELATPTLVHASGVRDTVTFQVTLSDTDQLAISNLVDAGTSAGFTMPSDIDSIIVPFAVYGHKPQTLFFNGSGSVGLQVVNSMDGAILGTFGTIIGSAASQDAKSMLALTVPVHGLSSASRGATLKLKPILTGVRSDQSVVTSLGHIYSGPGSFTLSKADVSFEESSFLVSVPTSFGLSQNYPNPFNPTTRIDYQLSAPGIVSLSVYDVLGRRVADLAGGYHKAGYYTSTWNANTMSSGVYYVRCAVTDETGKQQFSKVEKVMLVK